MALQRTKHSEIPKDAVLLSENEALKYQINIIRKWPKPQDTFALNYGAFLSGGSTLLTAMYLNNHFRRKFKLGAYGRAASYLPICVVPAIATFAIHTQAILRNLLLLNTEKYCPVCLQVRAGLLQVVNGVVFPFIIAPVGCLTLVQRYNTYNVPSLVQNPIKVLELVQRFAKPIKNTLISMVLCHAVFGMALTHFEAEAVFKIQESLAAEVREEIDD